MDKAVKTDIIISMKITGIIFVIMVAVLNMLPFAAFASNDHAGSGKNAIECHCDAMKDMNHQNTYMISCSSSDKQTQESQNHSRAIISTKSQVSNPVVSSYIYPEADHFAAGVYLTTETPPPKSLV